VNRTLRRLAGVGIALIAFMLSASLAFAGQPVRTGVGLASSASHASRVAPTQAGTSTLDGADEGTETETDPETDATDTTDATDPTDPGTSDNCTVDLTQDPGVLLTLNHGSVVCSAANATTWDTTLYPTKGAWVSHWAKMNHGHDPNKGHGHHSGG
jgi:hypothetical protein